MVDGAQSRILLLLTSVLLSNVALCDGLTIGSVSYSGGIYTFHEELVQKAVASASFSDQRKGNGWTFLEIVTDESYPNDVQAYAAGLVEGFVTSDIIAQHWNNTVAGYCSAKNPTPYCKRLAGFISNNFDFMKLNIGELGSTDPYWHQIELFIYQLKGIEDGYFKKPSQPSMDIEPFGFLMFQIGGDLEDLEVALNKPEELRKKILGQGSCSALVKMLPGNEDLYVAQDTWSTYQSMLRILKKYALHYHQLPSKGSPLIPGTTMTFSSYPGNLYSGDDFYILSSGLVSMETTIGNSNPSLNPLIQPTSVFESIRNQVANRLAIGGRSWADLFSRYNSGTYNNQWMIVDYNKFTPGSPPKDNLLIILEQIPGLVIFDDLTPLLNKQSYWPSYNAPEYSLLYDPVCDALLSVMPNLDLNSSDGLETLTIMRSHEISLLIARHEHFEGDKNRRSICPFRFFPQIFNTSGCQANVAKHGDWFSYDKTPRALIFKRDHLKVKDIPSMMKLMRYNDYKKDELSRCECTPPYSAENAISARSDLNPKNGTYPFGALGHRSHGGIDMKMTSFKLHQSLDFMAISGPTHDDQPPFVWSQADFAADTPHEGQPDVFAFNPIQTQFQGSLNNRRNV